MAKDTNIILRCTSEFKAQIEILASKENRTVSNYIENLLISQLPKENKSMSRTPIKEYQDLEAIKEWFERNDYHVDELKVGDLALYKDGYQDADFFEIEEDKKYPGLYNLYSC